MKLMATLRDRRDDQGILTMRCLLTTAIVLFASFAWSQGTLDKGSKQQDKKAEQTNTKSDTNKNIAQHPPVVITGSPTVTANNEPKDKGERGKLSSAWEPLIGVSTFALALITFFLAYFTYRLWQSTGKLVKGADETARKDLRAYLGATPQDIRFLSENHLQTHVEITNTGKTPAKNVRQWTAIEVRKPDDNKIFQTPTPVHGRRPIVPGHNWLLGIELTVTKEQLAQLANKERVIFVWGRAEYTDCFGDQHWLDFRYQNIGVVFVQTADGQRQSIGWALYPEEEGNDAT